MIKPRIYTMSFARVYPEYINKAEKKGRTKAEVDEIFRQVANADRGAGATVVADFVPDIAQENLRVVQNRFVRE